MALRVMSYNILLGGEDRLPHIIGTIRSQRPDLVALLEANSRANAESIAKELEMQVIYGEGNSDFHVAWLSRLPLLRSENHRLPVFSKTLLELELIWEKTRIHLFAAHLRSGRNAEGEQKREEEIQAIIDITRKVENTPHLLVGDLNTLHPSDRTGLALLPTGPGEQGKHQAEVINEPAMPRLVIPHLLSAGYVDCYRRIHPIAPGYTYKLPNPYLRLDYMFASIEMSLHLHICDVVYGDEATVASDHLPLIAEFVQ
jgi:exodeoxyribonuclease-3